MTLQLKMFGNLKPALLRMLLLPSPARLVGTFGLEGDVFETEIGIRSENFPSVDTVRTPNKYVLTITK